MFWQLWWVWMVAAGLLAILEMLVPAFVFLGFAVGAAITGLLTRGSTGLRSYPLKG